MTSSTILLAGETSTLVELDELFSDREGCEVVTAATASDALRLIREDAPNLIVLDARTPGISVEDLCTRIREIAECREAHLIVIAPGRAARDLETLGRTAFTQVVLEPVTGEDLLERVAGLLQMPRRVHLRTRVALEVLVGVSGDRLTTLGYSEDIGEGGMRVDVTEPLEVGSSVSVSLTLLSGGRRVETRAEVMRVDRSKTPGMFSAALRFTGSDPAFLAAVRALVAPEGER